MNRQAGTHKVKVNVFYLGTEIEGAECVYLMHSLADIPPDRATAEQKGRYIRGKTRIWVRAGEGGTWQVTPYTALVTAMDDLLRPSTNKADEAVARLVSGQKIRERQEWTLRRAGGR